MEVCQGGDLLSYVRKRKKLNEGIAKYIFRQIIIGIGYIHKQKIVHRDIKLENILIDNEGVVKIADFGISKILSISGKEKLKDRSGTPAYMAPEICVKALQKDGHSFAVDIWSAGVVLYTMIYGKLPFKPNKNKNKEVKKDAKKDDKVPDDVDLVKQIENVNFFCKDGPSEGCIKLIKKILMKEPENRLSINDILSDNWLKGAENLT